MEQENGEHIRENVAILRTDIEWIKEMLKKLDEKLDRRDEEWRGLIKDMREENEHRFHDLEKKVEYLENEVNGVKRQLAKLWGALTGLSIFALIIEILHHLGMIP